MNSSYEREETIMKEFFSAFSHVREKECNEGMTNTKICKK